MRKLILILYVILFSCNSDCKINKSLENDFFLHYKIVSNFDKETNVMKRREAIFFLSALTGIESRIDDIEHTVYFSKNKYRDDLKDWKAWYKKNKCVKDYSHNKVLNKIEQDYGK